MARNYAIDFIKGIGLLLIAALHITLFGEFSATANWVVNTEMRFVVPFFFLASGYLLFKKLSNSDDIKKIFRSYIVKISTYYFIGVVICFAFDYFVIMPIWQIPAVLFKGYVSGNFWTDFLYYGLAHMSGFHLWFLLAMAWASVIIFIACRNNLQNIKIVTIMALILHLIGLFGINQPYSQFFKIPLFPRDAVFFGLFYLSLGGMWAMGGINFKKYIPMKYNLLAIIVFFILALVERTALVCPLNAPFGEYWGEYFLMTIPLTMAIFQYSLDNSTKFKYNIFTKIGAKSIGIYILHAIAINITYIIMEYINKEIYKNPGVQVIQLAIIMILSYISYSCLLLIRQKIGFIFNDGLKLLQKKIYW